VPYGALTQLWAGTSPEGGDLDGKVFPSSSCLGLLISHALIQYLIPWAKVGPVRPDSQDPKTGKDLWEWLDEQVKDI
jgi:retinol dehydrogenase-12